MSTNPTSYPGIPTPVPSNLYPTVEALVEVVELLVGARGDGSLAITTYDQGKLVPLREQIAALKAQIAELKPNG